ncbi:MAG: two-component regulator propeller domain-containing protein [Bacteroidia bacterium]|nr:two-component regulator propeller domain-containing protein [Bacteroidia bacterium]
MRDLPLFLSSHTLFRWPHWVLFLLFCLILNVKSYGQVPIFISHPSPGENVHAKLLYQDSNGFIWAGTKSGLFSFDGINWRPVLVSDSTTERSVTAIYESANQQLWIGYESGKIDILSQGKIAAFEPEEGTPVVPITGFQEDAEANIWISTYGEGLYYWFKNRLYSLNADDGLPDNDVYVIAADNQKRIWAGTDRGIGICYLEKGEKKVEILDQKDGLPDNIVREIVYAPSGEMWIGMYDGGVGYYTLSTKKFHTLSGWISGSVSSLLPLASSVWVGTEHDDLWVWEDGQFHPIEKEKTQIYDMLADREGNVWVSVHTRGIQSTYESLSFEPAEKQVLSIHCGKSNVWYSTEDGLFCYNRTTGKTEKKASSFSANIVSIYEDETGNLWLGTIGDGVWHLDIKTGQKRPYREKDGLANDHVMSIDGKGNEIWFATFGGVSRFRLDDQGAVVGFDRYSRADGLSIDYIYQVYVDKKGRVWFATDGKGVSMWEDGEISTIEGLDRETVFGIDEDPSGNLWFSTEEKGVCRIPENGEEDTLIFARTDVATISSFAVVSDQALLITYPTHIDMYYPSSGRIVELEQDVGVSNIGEELNVIDRDKKGRIWIGANGKLIRFSPSELQTQFAPATRITGVKIFLEDIGDRDPMNLAYNENHVSFNYVGLWYQAPRNVRYEHRLVGYDIDWVESRNQQAIYPSLSSGTYTFELRSSLLGDFSRSRVVSYTFHINKPFWQTWWFFLLAITVGITLTYIWVKNWEKRLRRTERLEKEKIESQFETLKSQINPHFLFNSFNTLISIIENDQEVAVKYVEKLSDLFRNILAYRHQAVISLKEELTLFENFHFLQKHRYGDNFQVNLEVEESLRTGSSVPPLTLQLLVENALKHNIVSRSKPLRVDIHSHKSGYLTVQNNLQVRREKAPSTQMGLQNIVHRYRLLSDQEVIIEVTKTHFLVHIPLLKNETTL